MVVAYKNVNGVNVTIAASKSIYATTTGGEKGVAKSVSIKQVGNQKKTNKITLSIGETAKISATEVKKDKPIKRYRKLSYESSNSDVATVSKKGVITAKGTGTCKIYVYAQNGVYKTIKVTVN